MELVLILFFIIFCLGILAYLGFKRIKKQVGWLEVTIGTFYFFSLTLFAIGLLIHSNPYYKAIDPLDGECYSPFSENDILTLNFYFLAFHVSLVLVWVKGNVLPPLTLVLSLIFILIGVIFNIGILLQVSDHDTDTLDIYSGNGDQFLFFFAPLFSIILGIYFLGKSTLNEITEARGKTYSNKFLNFLNTFLATRSRSIFWIIILMFPVFFIVTILLILLGQDTNSFINVFTDTATWKFSQKMHPPVLDHKGHYLCTVAALGSPKVVKPIRLGKRHGNPIVVNRQLMIANAFEEMIHDISPSIHRKIRIFYDEYGYNLSQKINTTFLSNATYLLMKPLEWIFLICLYLFCSKPEQKINNQYIV